MRKLAIGIGVLATVIAGCMGIIRLLAEFERLTGYSAVMVASVVLFATLCYFVVADTLSGRH